MNELDFILVKPAGPDCNLNCEYCFYLEKAALFPESPVHRMGEDTLKILIRQSSELNSQQITFGWQGGEPLLMGLPFFKHAVLLQKEFFKGRFVENTFQTNGIFIDRDWGKFFRENHFLLGLSIDGPQEIHDRFRRNGKGSFERVMAAWKILQEENVEVNSVTSVHRESQDCVDEIYSFLKEIGFHWMQFIPIVERDPKSPRSIRSFSVTPKGYGDFLCRLFDHWLKGFHLGKSTTPIRWFESLFFSFVGLEAPECTLKKNCGQYLVVEYNGDVYPCDFFVEPGWKLGNIHQDHLAHLAQSHRRQEFARRKRVADAHCMKCRWLRFCYGGCPKDRFKGQLNYLCPAYSCFFQHAEPTMKKMAGLWKSDNRIGQSRRKDGVHPILLTSFGEVRHRLDQVKERTTGTVVFPLVEKLRIEPYRRYQGATLEAPVGQAVHLSYRLAAKETQRIRGQGPSKSTIWRQLQELAEAQSDWPSFKDRRF